MPAQKPGSSKQDYQTEARLLVAVKHKLQIPGFSLDAAADPTNAVADLYYTVEENGLLTPWNPLDPQWEVPIGGVVWCNMPFEKIEPWVEKAWAEAQLGTRSALLVPAGVGSDWWGDWVHGKAQVWLLNGRLCFIPDWATTIDPATLKDGKTPACYTQPPLYPKDCCVLIYGPEVTPGYEFWYWREEIPHA
jgi:phage N-6-adenine-methyltransferase